MTLWQVLRWVGAAVGLSALIVFFALIGLDRADQLSSVLSLFFTVAPWLNSVADMLDKEMDGAASDAKSQDGINAVFADPRNAFYGKTVCGDPEYVNGVVANGRSQADAESPKPAMASFHPKIAGARLYADVLQQYLP